MSDKINLNISDIEKYNRLLENYSAEEIIKWSLENLGPRLEASSSFQTQSVPLLHILHRIKPEIPIVFIETGYHFPETLEYRDRLTQKFGLNLKIVSIWDDQTDKGTCLDYQPENQTCFKCCTPLKVETMRKILKGLDGIIAGVRRDQTKFRKDLKVLELQQGGAVKIHPLLNWTDKDVIDYIEKYNLPKHPLFDKGYRSIGCYPCTKPVLSGENVRDGRWPGSEKTECGLHTQLSMGKTELNLQ